MMDIPIWLQTMLQSFELKSLRRSGWGRKNITDAESVAAHSWGVALLVLNTLPPEYDLEKALSYATLHDLGESIVGDITPFDGISPKIKMQREAEAMHALCVGLPNGARMLKIWVEYEEQQTDEARFVRQLDRLDMAIQALFYIQKGQADLYEFIQSADVFITDPALRPLIEDIKEVYHRPGRLNPPS